VRLAVRREGIAICILKAPEWIGATPRITGSTRARMVVVSQMLLNCTILY
jgi:hypothetical protein